jgi:hypothetical protein
MRLGRIVISTRNIVGDTYKNDGFSLSLEEKHIILDI